MHQYINSSSELFNNKEHYRVFSSKHSFPNEPNYDFHNVHHDKDKLGIHMKGKLGTWEAALCEISYHQGNYSIHGDYLHHWQILVDSPLESLKEFNAITPTKYCTILRASVINNLTTATPKPDGYDLITEIEGALQHLKIRGSPTEGNAIVKIGTYAGGAASISVVKGYRLAISRTLAHLIGFPNEYNTTLVPVTELNMPHMVWINDIFDFNKDTLKRLLPYRGSDGFKFVQSLLQTEYKLKEIQVMCNLIQPEPYGDVNKAILKSIQPSSQSYGSLVTHVFTDRIYRPLQAYKLDWAKITIKGKDGETNVIHPYGRVKLLVHFRHKKQIDI